jgi:hypothetical protein
MLGHHEYKGLWWTPGNEDGKLTGDLTVRKGSAELEVIGDFGRELLAETARVKSYSSNLADQPRVLGVSVEGKPITLEMVSERGHSVNLPGLPISKYRAGVALIGKHFEEGESVAFVKSQSQRPISTRGPGCLASTRASASKNSTIPGLMHSRLSTFATRRQMRFGYLSLAIWPQPSPINCAP